MITMKKHQRSKCSDPMIVARVKHYLAENVDQTFVDVSQMARSLRERYKEYSNRNEKAFCQMVEGAYKIVLKSYGLDEASSSSGSDEDSDDLELLDDNNSNALNDQLMSMYKMQDKKSNKKGRADGAEKTSELIDISSDDESNTEKIPKFPKLNDQITISPHVPDYSLPKVNKQVIPVVSINASTETPTPIKYDVCSTPIDRKRKANHETPKSVQQKKKAPVADKPAADNLVSKVTFDDIGGMGPILEQVCDLIMHMKHPQVYKQLGVKTPRGALLHGPPGSGKTLLAGAIAGRLGLQLLAVGATELIGGISGESEKKIRELFEKAVALAPCVLFIDEIDAISGNRNNAQKDMEKRIVAQLLISIDSLADKDASVLVLAATNSPDSLDPSLRRAGRLEQEIALGIPTLSARKEILRIMCRSLKFDPSVDLDAVGQLTPGFVGADLQALINKSCTVAIKRVFKLLKENTVSGVPLPNIPTDEPALKEETAPVTENGQMPDLDNELGSKKENGEILQTVNSEEENSDNVVPVVGGPATEEVVPFANNLNECKTVSGEDAGDGSLNCVTLGKVESASVKENLLIQNSNDIQKYLDEIEPFTPEQLSAMMLCQDDILTALKTTRPCASREGFATVPDTTWDDIGSLSDVRRDLQLAVLAPVKYPDQLESLGLSVPSGVLLCGPPGCGKTLLAKAVANEAGINFISVKGPELLNMYVGESERAVRTCFQRARNSSPCVIFFDEFDSLCPRRVSGETGGATRVVNQLLTEMDGVEGREGVFVLAATNRPDIIDPAVLRPGRLDRVLFVGMPLLRDREDILKAITKKGTKPQLSCDVDLQVIAAATEGYTGADLAGLVRLAATQALTDYITGNATSMPLQVSANHFQKALMKMRPSVSPKEQQHYEKLRLKYATVGEEKIDVEMDTTESMDTV